MELSVLLTSSAKKQLLMIPKQESVVVYL